MSWNAGRPMRNDGRAQVRRSFRSVTRRDPCAEWPNCECPKCNRFREKQNRAGCQDAAKVIGLCHYCGEPATTRDHKTPISKGGSRRGESNLVPACWRCNQRKGSMSYEEFMTLIGKA